MPPTPLLSNGAHAGSLTVSQWVDVTALENFSLGVLDAVAQAGSVFVLDVQTGSAAGPPPALGDVGSGPPVAQFGPTLRNTTYGSPLPFSYARLRLLSGPAVTPGNPIGNFVGRPGGTKLLPGAYPVQPPFPVPSLGPATAVGSVDMNATFNGGAGGAALAGDSPVAFTVNGISLPVSFTHNGGNTGTGDSAANILAAINLAFFSAGALQAVATLQASTNFLVLTDQLSGSPVDTIVVPNSAGALLLGINTTGSPITSYSNVRSYDISAATETLLLGCTGMGPSDVFTLATDCDPNGTGASTDGSTQVAQITSLSPPLLVSGPQQYLIVTRTGGTTPSLVINADAAAPADGPQPQTGAVRTVRACLVQPPATGPGGAAQSGYIATGSLVAGNRVLTSFANANINSSQAYALLATGGPNTTDVTYTLVLGDRVLLPCAQFFTAGSVSDNGIYVVAQVGDGTHPWILTQATDYNFASVTSGMLVEVQLGADAGGSTYQFAGLLGSTANFTRILSSRVLSGITPTASAAGTVHQADLAFTSAINFSLAGYSRHGGVLTSLANEALGTVDGQAPALGSRVWLSAVATPTAPNGLPSDEGLYCVTALGTGGVSHWQLVRVGDWASGATIPSGTTVEVGGAGAFFGNTTWKTTSTTNIVVDTGVPLAYPQRFKITGSVLVGGLVALVNVPILSATKTQFNVTLTTWNTGVATARYVVPPAVVAPLNAGGVVAVTPGPCDTGAGKVAAQAIADGSLNAADVGTVSVEVVNF